MCLLCFPSNLKSHLTKLFPVQFKKHINSPLHEIRALQFFLVTKQIIEQEGHSEIKPAGQTNQAQHVY